MNMRIFELRPDSSARWLTLVNEDNFALEQHFRGAPFPRAWEPLTVSSISEHGMPDGELTDYPTLGSIPIFSRRAVEALRPALESNGELLPLVSAAGEFYAFNITRVLDVLDERRSKLVRFESTGRVMKVESFAFAPGSLNEEMIFKIKQLPRGQPFVTQMFVDLVTQNRLTGFQFEYVGDA
jgi:hypothetical protein